MQRHASVVIFGGTSEGRELAEYAEARHIPVLVSVVSGYGESLLRESDLVQVPVLWMKLPCGSFCWKQLRSLCWMPPIPMPEW